MRNKKDSQYLVNLARDLMGKLKIKPQAIIASTPSVSRIMYQFQILAEIEKMTPETLGRIIWFGLAVDEIDQTCSPVRKTTISQFGQGLVSYEGAGGVGKLRSLAVDTILSAMWDIAFAHYVAKSLQTATRLQGEEDRQMAIIVGDSEDPRNWRNPERAQE